MNLSTCESDKPEILTNTNITDNSIAYREAMATGYPNGDCPESFTEDQSAATGLVPTKLKGNCDQTDFQGKLNQETKPTSSHGIEHEKETIPETLASQIENGRQDKLNSNLEILDAKSRLNQSEREDIIAEFEDRVPEKSIPEQAVDEETTLPNLNSVGDTGIGVHTEQNSFKNKDTVGQSGSELDHRIISKNAEEQLRHKNGMPVTETYHSSDADNKAENVVAVGKQDPSPNLSISKESQFIPNNAKTMAKVPGNLIPSSQSMMTKDSSDNVKLSLSLASVPKNLEKDCQEFSNSKTTKNQSQSIDNSKVNVFTPQPLTNVNNSNSYMNNPKKDFKLYGSPNGVNLKTTPRFFDVHTSQSFSTPTVQTKPSMPLLSQISADNSTRFQRSHFGEGQMPDQLLYQPNKPLQANMQRSSDVSSPMQRASSNFMDNCTLLQNKYVNEINPTNQINLYNANQNKTDTDQGPLNLTDTRPKLIPNNYKTSNVVRLEIQNMSQQHNQPTTHSVRSSNLSGNDKEMFESDPRFSFPTTPGMNNGFSNNQRSYCTSYDAQSMQYVVHSDNSNIRRNSLWDRTATVGNGANNNQRAGIFSVQQFQQNTNQFGSQYLLMWPNPSDQMTGTDKLRIPQHFTNQGIIPYQQTCKNIFPNPVKDNNIYSNPNDVKRFKNQFSDGRMGLFFDQNQGKIANTAISHDRNHQQARLQSIPRTYNTNGKGVPPHQSEIFRNRENNNYHNSPFPVSQNSLQWAQSSEYAHHPNFAGHTGNDLKIRIPNESQSSSHSLAQSQTSNSHLQTPSYDHHYPELRHFPLTNANRFPVSDAMPPPPKIQNSTRSNFQTGHSKYPIGSQSNLQNPEIPTFQGQRITTATSTITATTLEAQKKTNTSTRDGSRLTSGQHSEPLRYRNNTHEFGTGRPGQEMTTYPTKPTMVNSSKLGTRFPPPDTNTSRPNYTNSSTSNQGPSPNNPDSILTWSQYNPQNPDLTRPLHQSQSRGYMNSDSQQRGQNVTQFNSQQNNIDSPFYVSQSYNNYMQQLPSTVGVFQGTPKSSNSISGDRNVETTYKYTQQTPSTADGFQKTPRPPNSSNSISKDGNIVTTYNNSNTSDQTFETVRTENQVIGEKFPVSQEISNNMAADKVTLKAETQQRKAELPAINETNKSKPTGNEQFQGYNCVSGLYPKCPEVSAGINRSELRLPSSSVSGSSTKPDDFLSKALTNPNLGMTSEESFLFSDFDPLFSSSLLTNDLDYFPENNAAYDQCFEDAASVTMAMVAHNQARTQETLDPIDTNFVHVSPQQQLTPLLNITGGNNGGCSATDSPSPRIQYNQIPPSQATMGGTQINNQYNSGVDNGKHLAPLVNKSNESMFGYVPGVDLLTLSSKTISSNVAKPGYVYANDSVQNRFSDLYNVNSASHVAIPISYDKSGKKLINTKGTNAELCDVGIKRRNRPKKERLLTVNLLEEATKTIKKKAVVSKGPPRPRGRPPKNRILAITNVHPIQSMGQEVTIPNPAASSNIGIGMSEKNLPKPKTSFPGQVSINRPLISTGMENSSPAFPVCGKLSAESEIPGYHVGTSSASVCISDKTTSPESGSLVSEEPGGNASVSIKSQRELSDREVIDVVTKCLESISRNEEQPNSNQINEGQQDTNSENTISSLDGSVLAGMDLPTGSDSASREEQALSKEETLMKAYIELKKKLEERMSRSLWRQSYLKREEPKPPKYSRKLSKKECMTAYSGTTSLGPEDDVFSRYPNRSTSSNDSGKLVVTADSTSINIDINSDGQKEVSNPSNLGTIHTEPIKNPVTTQEQIPVSSNQQISSTELYEPKSSSTPRLPSMKEVVRTRLSNETPSLNTSNLEPLTPEVPSESPVPNGNIPRKRTESVEEANDEEIFPNESERIKNPEGEDTSNLQPGQARLLPRHLPLQPYSPSPLFPPPPPPPIPPKVVHCLSKREKKVGPTIVENAKNCFEAIGKYLTTADSDFDSFLISYANIVQGLLNCGADRYSRIKAILLNRPNLESGDGITGVENKTSAVNRDDARAQEPSLSNRDIDASDIQGDADRREDQIDVDGFSSSYADIVKVILSSRADEYRNIKQVLSRHICGFTDLCQWPTNTGKKVSNRGADVDDPVPANTGCDEVINVARSKAKQNADVDVLVPALTGCDEIKNVALSKVKQKPQKKRKGNISENSATKTRRKRKIKESIEDIGKQGKLVFHDEILETEVNQKTPRQRIKKLSKNGSTLKDQKRSSFDDNGHSSGFRIILSSNSFIEQNVTCSDSSFNIEEEEEKEDENMESRRPVSSDDGFVEESTGDYIMNMDSESGGETKFPGISETGYLNGTEQQQPGAVGNTNILENVQPKIPEEKTATNTHSTERNMKKVLNCEGSISDETPKVAVDDAADMDKVTTINTENNEEEKRQRPSRKSAGVGAIKCPCGCCDDESSLKRDSVENNSRSLSMSFKKRNRTKIIKPKSANPSKGRGRPRKIDTHPEKIISKLVKPIGDTPSIRSGGEEPPGINMSEDLLNSFSVTNKYSQIRATRDNNSNFRRRESYSQSDSDSDSNAPSDGYVFLNSSGDSDERKPKKSGKNGNQKTPEKNQRDFKYNLLHNNIKASFVGDGTAWKMAEENNLKLVESASDENETCIKNESLNPNEDLQSLESSKGTTETSFKEFDREESVSKARISFKDFVPNLNSTPLPKIPKEENPNPKNPDSLNSIEASGIFTGNDSDIKVESNESFEYYDRQGDQLTSTSESGGQNLTDNDVIRNIKTEVDVNSPSPSNDSNFQPKADEIRGLSNVPKEEQLEDIETKRRYETPEKPKESSSCEERLRSLIETITEINTAIKQVDEDRSDPVKSGSVNNLSESFMKDDLESLDCGHLGPQNSEEMRVKTEIVERIDETIGCQIGLNDMDDSSINSSSDSNSDSSSGSSSSEEEEPRTSMSVSHNLISPMDVKLPSPLNSRKRKLSQTLKVTSVDAANKIIIRKTWQEKSKRFRKRKTKNIFDIMSSNDTEDEGDFERRGLQQGNQNKKAYGEKKALSLTLGVKKSKKAQSSKSKVFRAKKDIAITKQDQNMDSDSDKPCLSLQKKGNDKSLMLSENQKSPKENCLKMFKESKKKQKRTKSFLTNAKTLPEFDGFNGSDSVQKDIHKNSQADTKITIIDNNSKIKPKKPKKSKIGLDEPTSNDQNICISFESPKGKKRTTLEPPNNSQISSEKEIEGKEMLIVSGIIRRSRDEIIDKSYSDPNFSTPLKPQSSLSPERRKDQAKLKPSEMDLPNLQCTYCPKYFKKPSELLYHTRCHTGERPFPCDQCDKSFVSNANLQRHRRTHSSERKHICPTCSRGFTQHYGMLVHQLIHSGLKPHKCPDCSSAFRTNGSLSSHRRKRHPEEVEKERV